MIVLGIDPGLAALGWGVVSTGAGRLAHVAHGVLTTKTANLPEIRLQEIYSSLIGLIEQYRPDQASVEKLYFMKNVTSALPVAEVRGVILLSIAQAGLPLGQYDPTQIKSALVGVGRAEKKQVQEMVRLLLGLPQIPTPDHAADALATAICHVHRQQVSALLPQRA